ncbi:MAG: SdpI family protein [Candidatus Shapirobacteria bacterium]
MKKIIPLFIIAISFIVAIFAKPYMPPMMASHWGINSEVNGYMEKNFGLFFMPVLSISIYFLFLFLPKIDPYKNNFSQFKNYYDNFIIVIFGFLFYVYLLTIFWNLGYNFNLVQFLTPAFSLLFYFTGVLTQHTKMNWFVGIRTPWTMSNPIVWQKTHAIGGKLFKLVGFISLFGIIFPNLTFYLLFVPIIITVIFVFGYSYVQYLRYNQE